MDNEKLQKLMLIKYRKKLHVTDPTLVKKNEKNFNGLTSSIVCAVMSFEITFIRQTFLPVTD